MASTEEETSNGGGYEASMNKVDLNNFLVNLRTPLRYARRQVVQKLTRNINKLKKRKDSEKHEKKIANYLLEIHRLKALNRHNCAKMILSQKPIKTMDLGKIEDPEERCVARLFLVPKIQQIVAQFRKEHPDWPSLAAFVLSAPAGGRRFKKSNAMKSTRTLGKQQMTQLGNSRLRKTSQVEVDNNSDSDETQLEHSDGDSDTCADNPIEVYSPSKTDKPIKEQKTDMAVALSQVEKPVVKKTKDKPKPKPKNKDWMSKVFTKGAEEEDVQTPDQHKQSTVPVLKPFTSNQVVVKPLDLSSFGQNDEIITETKKPKTDDLNVPQDYGDKTYLTAGDDFFDFETPTVVTVPKDRVAPLDNLKTGQSVHKLKKSIAEQQRKQRFPDSNKQKRGHESKNDTNEQLHPSWAAKKQQRYDISAGSKAKRVVFD